MIDENDQVFRVLGHAGEKSPPALLGGQEVARPAAVISQSIMGALTAVFVALCVKSFIDARKARQAGA